MSFQDALIGRIQSREARVGVVGAGYVGLPLAVEFAEAGFWVTVVDIDQRKVDLLNRGKSYVADVSSKRLQAQVESGHLFATNSYEELRKVDTISICVPTPLRKTKDPDMSFISQAIESIADIRREGILVVLESTTYPGTTEEVILPHLVGDGLVVGENIFVAFSPERIDPGNEIYGVRNTPRVVGGITPACTEVAVALYRTAVDQVIAVSSPTAAEMVKLLENTFRAVNIAFVNELTLMCDRLGVNVWEVIDAAATKPFGFMPFYPGPGLGGHCIPIDPHYLSWKLKTLNYTARFIELASEVNTSMPLYVVDKVTDALNSVRKAVRGSRIVILGVSYKPNVNDVRESPALDIIHLLLHKGANVVYHDPHVPDVRIEDGSLICSQEYSEALIERADCVVIITNHRSYDWQHVLDHCSLVVDTRNATRGYRSKANVITL